MNENQRLDPLVRASEFWRTILLHRWSVLFATVVLAAISIVLITLLPDSYMASTGVLFDPQKLPDLYVAQTVTADPAQRLNTLTQEVLSAGRLEQIRQQLNLFPAVPQGSQRQIIDQMRKNITVDMKPAPAREMSAFVISYTADDAQVAAAVANRLAQSFIDWDLANREQQAASTKEFMTTQLQEAKQTLDSEEAKLDEYKLKHSGELPEQLQSNTQTLSTLHANLQSNEEAVDKLEQEKTMLAATPETERVVTGPPTERDRLETERRALQAQLTQLRSEYTEQYPDVVSTKAQLEAVTKQLSRVDQTSPSKGVSQSQVRLQIINREIGRLQEEQAKLTQRIAKYQAQVDATSLRGQEMEFLSRNYSNARDQYEGLLDKKIHADMAMDLEHQQKSSRFVVDPAQVPEKPIKPNRLILFAAALSLSLFVPAGTAIALAEVRGTVNNERALRSLLPEAARVIGYIPMINTESGVRRRRRLAMFSILGSFICCIAVAAFLWGGIATHMRRNHAHRIVPSNPSAELLPR